MTKDGELNKLLLDKSLSMVSQCQTKGKSHNPNAKAAITEVSNNINNII